MKKSAFIAAITLCASVAMISCSENVDMNAPESAKGRQDGLINIRCYNLDSVSVHYKLVEKLNAEAEAAMKNYQTIEMQKSSEIQRLAQSIEEKMRNNGYLSEQSYNADMQNLQNKQNQAQAQLQSLQAQIAQQAAAQQQQLIDSINNFLKAYNAVNKFDAILVMQPGTYFSDKLDITDEVIKGLNDRYNASEAAADKADKAAKEADKGDKADKAKEDKK